MLQPAIAALGRLRAVRQGLALLQGWDQASPHQRRLAAARGAHHRQQAVIPQVAHQLGSQGLPSEEVGGVSLVEVLQPHVG